MLTHHVPHVKQVEVPSDEMVKLEARSRRRRAVVCLSPPQVSKRSKSFGCWRASCLLSQLSCLSSFCWTVNCLLYVMDLFWRRSSTIDCEPPYPYGGLQSMRQSWPPLRGHHECHVPKRYENYSLVPRPCMFVACSTKFAQRPWARSSHDVCHSLCHGHLTENQWCHRIG